MNCQIQEIHPQNPQPRIIAQAVSVLQRGGLIAYPTDSYYGLGCDLMNKKAIEKLYLIKGSDRRKPMSFLVPDLSDVTRYAKVSNFAYKVIRRLAPGPFTFILEATRLVPDIMQTKQRTIGLRIPENAIAQALCRELENPIVSTSAQPKGGVPLQDPEDIRDIFGHGLDVILSTGISEIEPTTILSLVGDEIEVLRQGKGDPSSAF